MIWWFLISVNFIFLLLKSFFYSTNFDKLSEVYQDQLTTPEESYILGEDYNNTRVKLKVDFGSFDTGTKIIEYSKGIANIKSIQSSNNDLYMLVPCKSDIWWIYSFSDIIHIEKIGLISLEHYASNFKVIEILGSDIYPTKKWKKLGKLQTDFKKSFELFNIYEVCKTYEEDNCWVKYLKVNVLSYHNVENNYYCTLTNMQIFASSGVDMLSNQIYSEANGGDVQSLELQDADGTQLKQGEGEEEEQEEEQEQEEREEEREKEEGEGEGEGEEKGKREGKVAGNQGEIIDVTEKQKNEETKTKKDEKIDEEREREREREKEKEKEIDRNVDTNIKKNELGEIENSEQTIKNTGEYVKEKEGLIEDDEDDEEEEEEEDGEDGENTEDDEEEDDDEEDDEGDAEGDVDLEDLDDVHEIGKEQENKILQTEDGVTKQKSKQTINMDPAEQKEEEIIIIIKNKNKRYKKIEIIKISKFLKHVLLKMWYIYDKYIDERKKKFFFKNEILENRNNHIILTKDGHNNGKFYGKDTLFKAGPDNYKKLAKEKTRSFIGQMVLFSFIFRMICNEKKLHFLKENYIFHKRKKTLHKKENDKNILHKERQYTEDIHTEYIHTEEQKAVNMIPVGETTLFRVTHFYEMGNRKEEKEEQDEDEIINTCNNTEDNWNKKRRSTEYKRNTLYYISAFCSTKQLRVLQKKLCRYFFSKRPNLPLDQLKRERKNKKKGFEVIERIHFFENEIWTRNLKKLRKKRNVPCDNKNKQDAIVVINEAQNEKKILSENKRKDASNNDNSNSNNNKNNNNKKDILEEMKNKLVPAKPIKKKNTVSRFFSKLKKEKFYDHRLLKLCAPVIMEFVKNENVQYLTYAIAKKKILSSLYERARCFHMEMRYIIWKKSNRVNKTDGGEILEGKCKRKHQETKENNGNKNFMNVNEYCYTREKKKVARKEKMRHKKNGGNKKIDKSRNDTKFKIKNGVYKKIASVSVCSFALYKIRDKDLRTHFFINNVFLRRIWGGIKKWSRSMWNYLSKEKKILKTKNLDKSKMILYINDYLSKRCKQTHEVYFRNAKYGKWKKPNKIFASWFYKIRKTNLSTNEHNRYFRKAHSKKKKEIIIECMKHAYLLNDLFARHFLYNIELIRKKNSYEKKKKKNLVIKDGIINDNKREGKKDHAAVTQVHILNKTHKQEGKKNGHYNENEYRYTHEHSHLYPYAHPHSHSLVVYTKRNLHNICFAKPYMVINSFNEKRRYCGSQENFINTNGKCGNKNEMKKSNEIEGDSNTSKNVEKNKQENGWGNGINPYQQTNTDISFKILSEIKKTEELNSQLIDKVSDIVKNYIAYEVKESNKEDRQQEKESNGEKGKESQERSAEEEQVQEKEAEKEREREREKGKKRQGERERDKAEAEEEGEIKKEEKEQEKEQEKEGIGPHKKHQINVEVQENKDNLSLLDNKAEKKEHDEMKRNKEDQFDFEEEYIKLIDEDINFNIIKYLQEEKVEEKGKINKGGHALLTLVDKIKSIEVKNNYITAQIKDIAKVTNTKTKLLHKILSDFKQLQNTNNLLLQYIVLNDRYTQAFNEHQKKNEQLFQAFRKMCTSLHGEKHHNIYAIKYLCSYMYAFEKKYAYDNEGKKYPFVYTSKRGLTHKTDNCEHNYLRMISNEKKKKSFNFFYYKNHCHSDVMKTPFGYYNAKVNNIQTVILYITHTLKSIRFIQKIIFMFTYYKNTFFAYIQNDANAIYIFFFCVFLTLLILNNFLCYLLYRQLSNKLNVCIQNCHCQMK